MRSVIVVACLLGVVAATGAAAPPNAKEKPKTVNDKIQGKWARRNHTYSFFIDGNKWSEFTENKINVPSMTGVIELPPGKEYAVVKAKNGSEFWLFPSGENVLAVETFTADGVIWEDGRVFYRPDFTP